MSTYSDADANSMGFRSSEDLLLWQQAQEKAQLVDRESQSVSDNAACGAQTIHKDRLDSWATEPSEPATDKDHLPVGYEPVADDALPEPVAWAAGIDANARGFIDVMAWSENEFTTPLHTAAQLRAAIARERDEVFRLQCRHSALYAELYALREQLEHERREHQSAVHSCHSDCKMAGCVNVRLREQLAQAVRDERERCAAICDQRAADLWHDYKDPGSPFRGDGRTEAMSDEAEECAKAIREGTIAATGEAK